MLPSYSTAVEDFRRARRQAGLQEVLARLQGREASLLSYDEVYRTLGLGARSERGIREIPVEAVVGSVGRYAEFTRTFLPRREEDESRWANVMRIALERGLDSLPPLEVYKIGEVYFVQDGNHRVSVARQLGIPTLTARVIEIDTPVPVTPDVQPDDLIIKAEYAEFLKRTRLDKLRPGADLSLTVPGGYDRLEKQINVCEKCIVSEDLASATQDAAPLRWYDDVYLPVVQAIRERGLLEDFPNRTETDLYLWIDDHRTDLKEILGVEIDPAAATAAFAAAPASEGTLRRALNAILPEDLAAGPKPGRWRREKMADRYTGRLFNTLLVPISGEPAGWPALDQALMIAKMEEAQILGLYVVPPEAVRESAQAGEVAAEFERRCQAAGVRGRLVVEPSEDAPARKIGERAVLADLVVLRLLHPPQHFRLGSGFRAVIQRCARPVLAVPEARPSLERALLAFDGSPRSHDALFVAAYLASEHQVALTVLTVSDDPAAGEATLDGARQYLDLHDVPATYLRQGGRAQDRLVAVAEDLSPDLLLLGGYGMHPMLEVVVGSTVDHVLREGRWPVLICR